MDTSHDDDVYTVSLLSAYLKRLFESVPALKNIWVEGELSNFKKHSSGHVYFTLKDDSSQLAGVMFRGDAAKQGTLPKHGDMVRAHGRISIYEPQGQYQLYCDRFQPLEAAGDLHTQFVALWNKLETEGLFAPETKRPIPVLPRRIGIVTSPTGAALQDVLNILRRRYPLGEVILSPTVVQGESAPPQIMEAIRRVDGAGVDVILLVRGGGSMEDLWCFNNEALARLLRTTRAPVVTGVGHEIDRTLVDGTADRYAPTPSAAAELSTPDVAVLRASLDAGRARVRALVEGTLSEREERLGEATRLLRLLSPTGAIRTHRQRVDDAVTRLAKAMRAALEGRRTQLGQERRALELANPDNLLKRGYAVVLREGRRISRVEDAPPGTQITLHLSDGHLTATVEAAKHEGKV
ncbi:MAG TPA: exodeoxyribonuclease VII large subunit [Aggregatilineales bacterium]|nr:exodeoxyribonuclease VII large subunit [Anaerolineales bacterium]HRE46202.1 exodeoxyribonuclease VII large subunit [Aggregatilineales bacterium]